MRIQAITVLLLGSALTAGVAVAQTDFAPENTPVTIGGVEAVCDGTGLEARSDARWSGYPMRLEFVGKDGQYLGDEKVNVSGNGINVSVHCEGPWVLMKLPAGTYHVSTDVAEGGHKDLTVNVPGHVIVRFPNAGGAEDRVAVNR